MSDSCNPMDYSPPGSSIHETYQARILEWVAISFSRGFSQPRDWTQVSCIAVRLLTDWATREPFKERWSFFLWLAGDAPGTREVIGNQELIPKSNFTCIFFDVVITGGNIHINHLFNQYKKWRGLRRTHAKKKKKDKKEKIKARVKDSVRKL